jgi:hypothetical protein
MVCDGAKYADDRQDPQGAGYNAATDDAAMIRPRFSDAKNSGMGTVLAMVPKKRLVCA